MKNKVHDLESYAFRSGEEILIDANIWLYLFPAPQNPSRRNPFDKWNYPQKYSGDFSKLIVAHAQPVLDPMILSEYLNRYIRIEWEGNYKTKYGNKFKAFRNSTDFLSVIPAAKVYAEEILKFCCVHSISANQLDLNQTLCHFSTGSVDFNDALLIDICQKRNLKLMTNDGDFQVGGIEVLTRNPKLLKARK